MCPYEYITCPYYVRVRAARREHATGDAGGPAAALGGRAAASNAAARAALLGVRLGGRLRAGARLRAAQQRAALRER